MSRLPQPSTSARLHASERGSASVEYLVVMAIVGISLAITLIMLGPEMVRSWSRARAVLYGPAP